MSKLDKLAMAMIEYDKDADRIQHFLKVHSLCHLSGAMNLLDHL